MTTTAAARTASGRLEDRAVFITGASRGIGRAIALACATEGATVGVGFHRSEDGAKATAAAIRALGAHAVPVQIDIADPDQVDKAVAAFASEAGRLDALVANAGAVATGLLVTATTEDLRRLVDTNVLGPLACARAALAIMLPAKRGALLFVGSAAASRPARGQAAYTTSKSAVETLTRAIAVEYGRKGIRAVCLRPGAVATAMLEGALALDESEVVARVPMRRLGAPEEIARVATMLLGDGASYINGAVVDVDGGYAAG